MLICSTDPADVRRSALHRRRLQLLAAGCRCYCRRRCCCPCHLPPHPTHTHTWNVLDAPLGVKANAQEADAQLLTNRLGLQQRQQQQWRKQRQRRRYAAADAVGHVKEFLSPLLVSLQTPFIVTLPPKVDVTPPSQNPSAPPSPFPKINSHTVLTNVVDPCVTRDVPKTPPMCHPLHTHTHTPPPHLIEVAVDLCTRLVQCGHRRTRQLKLAPWLKCDTLTIQLHTWQQQGGNRRQTAAMHIDRRD